MTPSRAARAGAPSGQWVGHLRRRRVLDAVLLATVVACGTAPESRSLPEPPADTPVISPAIEPSVIYGHAGGVTLTLDVYRPSEPQGAAVLFLRSGGWRTLPSYRQWVRAQEGPRLATDAELRERDPLLPSMSFAPLFERGITVFEVAHRDQPEFRMADIVEDVRTAVRFVRANAARWDVDPDRVGVWGASSGGHLGLLLGTTGAGVAAVVAYHAPTDLARIIAGRTPRNPALVMSAAEYREYSPLAHVSAGDAPALIVHGDRDGLVPLREGRTMHEALRAAGVPSRFVVVPGADHGFFGEDAERALSESVRWFETYLGVE